MRIVVSVSIVLVVGLVVLWITSPRSATNSFADTDPSSSRRDAPPDEDASSRVLPPPHEPEKRRERPGGGRRNDAKTDPEVGGRLSGRVVERQRIPVVGATVLLLDGNTTELVPASPRGNVPEWKSTTDAAGRFTFSPLDRGSYRILVLADGYAPVFGVPCTLAAGEVRESYEVRIGLGRTLEGQVVDREGVPLSGVRITAGEAPTPGEKPGHPGALNWATWMASVETPASSTTSGRNGYFWIDGLSDGAYWVSVEHSGFLPALVVHEAAEGTPLHIILDRPGSLTGVVRSQESRDAIPRYRLRLFPPAKNQRAVRHPFEKTRHVRQIQDREGRFRVSSCEPGEWGISVEARGYSTHELEGIELTAGKTVELEILLSRGGIVTGRVIDPDGNPLPGAIVRRKGLASQRDHPPGLEDSVAAFFLRNLHTARAGKDGRFRLDRVPAGDTPFRVTAPGFVRKLTQGTVVDDQTTSLGDIVLHRGLEFSSQILAPDGLPVEGGWVVLTPAVDVADKIPHRSRVSSVGRFSCTGLAPGSYDVYLHVDSSPRTYVTTVEVREGVEPVREIRLPE